MRQKSASTLALHAGAIDPSSAILAVVTAAVTTDGAACVCAQVSDFGLSKAFKPGAHDAQDTLQPPSRQLLMRSACGSASYAAPELFAILEGDDETRLSCGRRPVTPPAAHGRSCGRVAP
eukprot:1377202-Prymnesium_polylepis.1